MCRRRRCGPAVLLGRSCMPLWCCSNCQCVSAASSRKQAACASSPLCLCLHTLLLPCSEGLAACGWHEGAGAMFGLPLCVAGCCLSSWCVTVSVTGSMPVWPPLCLFPCFLPSVLLHLFVAAPCNFGGPLGCVCCVGNSAPKSRHTVCERVDRGGRDAVAQHLGLAKSGCAAQQPLSRTTHG